MLLFNELHYPRKTILKNDIIKSFKTIIDEIKLLKELITNSCKMVFWNRTSVDFITSDCPITFIRLQENDLFTSIYVPINTKISVLLVNKESHFFDKNIIKTGTILELEEDAVFQVETYNLAIAEKANRFVYSIDGRFPPEITNIEFKEWWNI